jgi:hypothetical protein
MVTIHVVQFSTGLGSAEVARRAVIRYGVENVHLLTADTSVEDEDNWRFADDVVEAIGWPKWTILKDGRTPMEAGRDARVVPNNRMAVCSRVLKRDLLRKHIEKFYYPAGTVIHLGFDWTEPHRMKAAEPLWAPWTVDALLMRPPFIHKAALINQWRRIYGIEPPRLYSQGFSHANCGGACVRGGQAQWQLLLSVNRDRYLDWEGEEEQTRGLLGKDVSILRDRTGGSVTPLTLRRFREGLEVDATLFDGDDWGACGCFMPDGATGADPP